MTGRPQTPPVRRDCTCPKTRHEHGTTTAYKTDGCRCEDCRAACAAAWRETSRLKAYGRFQPGRLDATGARRMLQALAAVGWSARALHARSDLYTTHIQVIRSGRARWVTAETERSVKALYDRLWDQCPPRGDRHQVGAITRTKLFAAQQGWAPPLAWDDEAIDDPTAEPATGHTDDAMVDEVAITEALAGRSVALSRAERAELVRLATERKMSAQRIAELAGRTARTVNRARAKVAA